MKLMRLEFYGIVIGSLLLLAALGLGRRLPEGELYAYTLPWRSEPAVYLMDIGRSVSVSLTKNTPRPDAYRLTTLSPDYSQIAVTIAEQGDGNLYLLDIWSGVLNPLLIRPDYDDQASWSPDGRWIAYSSLLAGDRDIYKVEVATGIATRLTDFLEDSIQPSWSPDGTRIVFVNGQNLFVMAAACPEVDGICGKNAQQITSSASSDLLPVWSPDGRQIAFMSDRSGRTEIYVMDADCLDRAEGCLQQNPHHLKGRVGRLHTLSWTRERGLLLFISDQFGRAGLYSLQPDCNLVGSCNLEPVVLVEA
jgi:dipeptidyl aminopeptidase/acylaminoacyl peptidase